MQCWHLRAYPISFQWISPMALAVNIAVGYVGCWIGNLWVKPDASTPARGMTPSTDDDR